MITKTISIITIKSMIMMETDDDIDDDNEREYILARWPF